MLISINLKDFTFLKWTKKLITKTLESRMKIVGSLITTRKNEYQICIQMNNNSDELLLDKELVPYPQSRTYFDEITIKKNEILVEAKRSGVVDLRGVFLNHQSALYRQITKALIYYYCSVRKPVQITSITLKRNSSKSNDEINLSKSNLNQVVDKQSDLTMLSHIDLTSLKLIFEETSKGHGYLYGLTFFIKSQQADTTHDKFENKWKAFNAIYKAAAGKTQDFECHQLIRKHMTEHPESYPLIISKVSNMSADDVRSNIRWIKFVHNNFSNIKQTKAFKEFILRNEDHRLIKIFNESLGVREAFLKEKNYYSDVVTHLKDHVSTVNDSHLAATLCIKYAYFVRNKLTHAENIESGFRLMPLNKEESEVTWLSSLLVLLIIDLINNNNSF